MKEVYTILSIDDGIYLPLISDANQSYLKGILISKKIYFLSKDIIIKRVLQIEHLRLKELINFASENCDIKSHLSNYDYNKELQREWL